MDSRAADYVDRVLFLALRGDKVSLAQPRQSSSLPNGIRPQSFMGPKSLSGFEIVYRTGIGFQIIHCKWKPG